MTPDGDAGPKLMIEDAGRALEEGASSLAPAPGAAAEASDRPRSSSERLGGSNPLTAPIGLQLARAKDGTP